MKESLTLSMSVEICVICENSLDYLIEQKSNISKISQVSTTYNSFINTKSETLKSLFNEITSCRI